MCVLLSLFTGYVELCTSQRSVVPEAGGLRCVCVCVALDRSEHCNPTVGIPQSHDDKENGIPPPYILI